MNGLNCEQIYKSKLLVEQHFHGCFGVDFSTCDTEDILFLSKKLLTRGIGGFFPTLVTDSVDNIKRQIEQIRLAKEQQELSPSGEMAQILGIHLEGIFINTDKKGIHDEKLFLKPTVGNYKLVEDDLIKIVTLAPELDENLELTRYLTLKGVKVQAGHCTGANISGCHGVTHLFNAMAGISHRESSTALSALINDNIYTEVVADGVHLSADILSLVFKTKPEDKVILVSDSLPLAGISLPSPLEEQREQAKNEPCDPVGAAKRVREGGFQCERTSASIRKAGEGLEMNFAGETIFFNGERATSSTGTIAGSTAVLDEIVKRLADLEPDNFEKYVKMASDNLYKYHNIELDGCVYWDEDFNIIAVEKDGVVLYRVTGEE